MKQRKRLEEPFYMLPVSIFELMIVPESQADEVEEMKKAIIESNQELPAEYLLSNSVYYYGDKGRGRDSRLGIRYTIKTGRSMMFLPVFYVKIFIK